jgi:O-antigen/teichoic acid export membrane protein
MTAFYANTVLGILGGVLTYCVFGILLDQMLVLPDNLHEEARGAIPWIASMVPLALFGGVARSVLEARERFLEVNVLDLLWVVLGQVLPLAIAIGVGPELNLLLPPLLIGRMVVVTLCFLLIHITKIFVFDVRRLREMLGFGVWVSVSSVISPLLTSIDQIFIGSVLGTTSVAHYAVPMNFVGRSQIVVSALGRALFPRFSRLGNVEAMGLAEQVVVSLGYAFGACCALGLILGGPLISLWLGRDFGHQASVVLQILMIGAWINGIAFIPVVLLHGQRRPDLVAKAHLLEVVPSMIVLWVLLQWLGVAGAALSWSVRVTADAIILLVFCGFGTGLILRLLPPFLVLLGTYAVAQAGLSIVTSLFVALAEILLFGGLAAVFDNNARRLFTLIGRRWSSASRKTTPVSS